MKFSWDSLNKRPLILLVVGLSIGGIGGWLAGQQTQSLKSRELEAALNRRARSDASRSGDGNHQSLDANSSRRSDRKSSALNQNPQDFAQSVRGILRETMPTRRVAEFEKMLENASVDQFPELVTLIRAHDLDGSGSADEWSRLWASWGTRDPIGAMAFMKNFSWDGWDGSAPGEARKQIITNWAQVNPEAAKRFIEKSPELANGDRSGLFCLVDGWARVDPRATADWLFKNGLALGGEYTAVVESISRTGGQRALETWFAGLDQTKISAKDRNGFAEKIAGKKLEHEPEKAAAWVEANLKESWVKESEVVISTALAYANRDPKAAMAWANRTGMKQATDCAMFAWCIKDVNAANQWANENSKTDTLYEFASQVMQKRLNQDPVAARAWAEKITNKALRDRLLNLE
jgi:hypothetical protein